MRVVILLASSCGLRIGAIPGLSVGSCEEFKDLFKITIYENEPEEYTVFTSELKKEILSYLDIRRRYGEVITNASPLVREQFDRRDQFRPASNAYPVKNLQRNDDALGPSELSGEYVRILPLNSATNI